MHAHGTFEIERHGAVVLSVVKDAWNEQAMRAYASEFKAQFPDSASISPWALIVDARGWRLAVPEVGPELAALARWKDTHGLVAAAYINDDQDLKARFAADNIFQHYRRAPIKLVSTPEDAIAWIEAHDVRVPNGLRERLD